MTWNQEINKAIRAFHKRMILAKTKDEYDLALDEMCDMSASERARRIR